MRFKRFSIEMVYNMWMLYPELKRNGYCSEKINLGGAKNLSLDKMMINDIGHKVVVIPPRHFLYFACIMWPFLAVKRASERAALKDFAEYRRKDWNGPLYWQRHVLCTSHAIARMSPWPLESDLFIYIWVILISFLGSVDFLMPNQRE